MEKTLARLAYDVMRKTQARANRQAKRMGVQNVDAQPSNKAKKRIFPSTEKKTKTGRYNTGNDGAPTEQSVAEEIKGTGGSGPGEVGVFGKTYGSGIWGISPILRGRLSNLTNYQIKSVMDKITNMERWLGYDIKYQEKLIRSSVDYYGF